MHADTPLLFLGADLEQCLQPLDALQEAGMRRPQPVQLRL